jgi:hypothetical protein
LRFQRGRGVISMVVVLLIAGIGLLLVGLLTVGFGIQLELSLGNTLIFTGAIVACTGVLMLGLWMVVRELKNIARGLGEGIPAESPAGTWRQPRTDTTGSVVAPEDGELLFPRDQQGPERAANAGPSSPLPWHEQTASRDRLRHNAPAADEPADAAPTARQRRNLMFSSSRKERERGQDRTVDSPGAPSAAGSGEPPPASFDDAWPKSERARAPDAQPSRRSGRAPSTFTQAGPAASGTERDPPAAPNPAAPNEGPPPATVLKAGVVDGMAYTLYSDGSIEAQMPEGMMRFASIEELRAHLDQRP